jgi:uncharacterized YkwD family protein
MGFKKTKIAVASLMLASLAACSQNKANNIDNTGPRNVSTGDLNHPLNNRNVSNDLTRVNNPTTDTRSWNDRNDEMNHNGTLNTRNVSTGDLNPLNNNNTIGDLNPMNNGNNGFGWNSGNGSNGNSLSTTEIQPSTNGFITIDHNSFSTDTPSHKFPHSKRVQQGNFWYYTFDPSVQSNQGKTGFVTPPQTGTQAFPVNPTVPKAVTPKAPTAPTTPAAPATPPAKQPTTQATTGINKVALQVIDLTNVERKKNGLPPLKADASLSNVAQTKSNDMEAKHYFSHTSPTYGSPFDMMRDFGVTYKSAGENIAMGQTTAQQVVTAWMNSEGHRKNILSPNYTNIGVGFTSNGNYWSQMFIGK